MTQTICDNVVSFIFCYLKWIWTSRDSSTHTDAVTDSALQLVVRFLGTREGITYIEVKIAILILSQ